MCVHHFITSLHWSVHPQLIEQYVPHDATSVVLRCSVSAMSALRGRIWRAKAWPVLREGSQFGGDVGTDFVEHIDIAVEGRNAPIRLRSKRRLRTSACTARLTTGTVFGPRHRASMNGARRPHLELPMTENSSHTATMLERALVSSLSSKYSRSSSFDGKAALLAPLMRK